MILNMLKCKLHRATVTEADLERWEQRGWIKGRNTFPESNTSDEDLPF